MFWLVIAALIAQATFEQVMQDLASADAGVRLRTVRMLKSAAYPEAAIPLATLVTDPQDQIQIEAIAAELNIFLADKIVPRRRVGLVVEVRHAVDTEAAFSSGPAALGGNRVPMEVLSALRAAFRDDHSRVRVEALYAFGTLAPGIDSSRRADVRRDSGPDLIPLIGAPDVAVRYAAVRVIGRVFANPSRSLPADEAVGDALIAGLNDKDLTVKGAVMDALGGMRYDRGVQALTDLFNYYGKGQPAEATLDTLARIGNPGSLPLFVSQLSSKAAAARMIAVEGIARSGDRSKLADVQSQLQAERVDTVQLAIAFASAALSDVSVDPIKAALEKPRLRDQAKQYLAELGQLKGWP